MSLGCAYLNRFRHSRQSILADPTGACGGVKWDHFYKGLSPEYLWMLAHKVNDEHPVTYSKLLLTAWKLERWAEVRDHMLPKTPTTVSSNVTHSHSQGNPIPSRKLKGNCTFTAQSVAVEDCRTEEDSGPKTKGEQEAKCFVEEDVGTTGEVGDVDPSLLGYTAQFANVLELHQKKNHNCFGCGSPDHLVKDCPKELEKTTWKVGLNVKEGMVKKGGQSSQKLVVIQEATMGNTPQA